MQAGKQAGEVGQSLYNFKPVVVAHTCNSSTKEAETGGILQDQGELGPHSKF